ncbi:MAG: hypothetical protein DSM107014_03595 [Gomphosphaeria aponina SAG 52.96 = DSM 107014]|uniref:Uncharacterized protein n=1 Tax=Gomphosphaeria aponina SAG 52.96 = DSM 107014 TaxID=1521640 RepID=A0A941GU24_9CHRO|nr:hypothetical protein [Gomphosphaeria aponina SAG 52.96 = DSM 107014]
MNFAWENIANAERQQKILALIETTLSREEIEAMFSLEDLKKTRYFREYAEQWKKSFSLSSLFSWLGYSTRKASPL